jgi:hypothetical protein
VDVSAFEWAAQLEASPLGDWMRSSSLAYPIANVVHVLGLVLLVGPIVLLDLRLLGFGQALPLPPVSRAVTASAVVGLVLLAGAGILMFAADAGPLIRNGIMQAKLWVIAFGLANALLFRALWNERLARWDTEPPLVGRIQALASIALWLSAGALGRWIAYS